MTYEPLQAWACVHCAKSGQVPYKPTDGSYAVVEKIRQAHAAAAPACAAEFGTTYVRVLQDSAYPD